MSLIKLDPETKFKWPEFDGDPLTEKENNNVLTILARNRKPIIDGFLSMFGLQECSGVIPIITVTQFRTVDGYKINSLFGTYKQSDLEPNLALLTQYSEDQKKYIRMMIKNTIGNTWETYSFETIKKKFRECASSNYFTVYLSLKPLTDQLGTSAHANMLVIAKNRGVVYWIEPQTKLMEVNYTNELHKSIKKLVEDLGMADPTIINPVQVCPQTITGDLNCMFWTYLIFILILLNPNKDHNDLVKQFLSKYSTKELLTRYIDGFKRNTLETLAPSAGRRRKTIRRYLKKRKTYRKRRII